MISVKFSRYLMPQKYCRKFQPPEQGARALQTTDDRQTDGRQHIAKNWKLNRIHVMIDCRYNNIVCIPSTQFFYMYMYTGLNIIANSILMIFTNCQRPITIDFAKQRHLGPGTQSELFHKQNGQSLCPSFCPPNRSNQYPDPGKSKIHNKSTTS